MSFIEFTKKTLMNFFVIVTGVTIAIAVLGMNFQTEAEFGYEAYFSPILIGAVATLPSFVLYSCKELTIKQMIIRKLLHFIVLLLTMVGFGKAAGLLFNTEVTWMFILSVFVVYVFTTAIKWILDSKTADEINKGLKRLQE